MSRLDTSLQDTAAPEGVCYGCGSRNPHGLHIKSFWHEDGVHVMAEHLPDVGRKSRVICEVYAGDVLTAIGDSIFVRVDTEQLAAVAHSR
ncbi:hypothetical protein ACYZT7_20725 [Pseudomonas sp. RT4P38]